MFTAQCSITIYSLVVSARTLAQVDLYINILHTVRCYGPCFCVRVWACVSVFERVCTKRLTSGAVVYGVTTVINTTQFAWRQPPDELGDQWWGPVGWPVKPRGEPDQLAFICLSLWLSVRFRFLFSFLYYCFSNIYIYIIIYFYFNCF